MNRVVLLLSAMMLASCGPTPSTTFRVASPIDAAIQVEVTKALPRLLTACKGLNTYAEDFTEAQVAASPMEGYEGGIELTFQIAASPRVLPEPLKIYSASNVCRINIDASGSRAYIPKRACHSVCTGEWQGNDAGLMGKELLLL